jgi:hypothetical protein
MKARVKATGDIIEISEGCSYLYAENYDKSYNLNELEFLDVKEKSLSKNEPDYWEKLKHQYAGQFMTAFINNSNGIVELEKLKSAIYFATLLVNRLKEESQCEK